MKKVSILLAVFFLIIACSGGKYGRHDVEKPVQIHFVFGTSLICEGGYSDDMDQIKGGRRIDCYHDTKRGSFQSFPGGWVLKIVPLSPDSQ